MAIVGIDVGTQSLKAVVVGDDLTVLGADSRAYGVDHPRPGWAQQDPAAWEEALAPAVTGALERAGVPASDVAGVGVAGQLDGCIAVGADGRALGPCLIWMDRRARDLPALPDDFRARTGLTADPGHMAAKIAWLRRNARGLGEARFHQPVSYLVERLCGEFVMDHGLASTTMLYGLARRDYEADLLACFGVERAALPVLADAGAPAGALTAEGAALLGGLSPGIPVAVGTGDDFATPLGAGVVAPGVVSVVIGTAEVVGGLSERPVIDAGGLVETHGYAAPGYFVENPGWLSGGAVTWLRGVLGASGDEELDGWADRAPPGCDGVTFLPALSGAMAPEWVASARGCFYGLGAGHERGHLARALLEGCALSMRDVVDRLASLGVPVDSVVLLGGGARSRTWGQIRADVLGRPIEIAAVEDSCPVGAALLGAVAAGVVPDAASGAAGLVGERAVIEPDRQRRAAYDDAHGRYRDLFESLRPLFDRDAEG